MSRNSVSGSRGFTLIEIMVGVAVLGTIMVAVFAGLTGGYAIMSTFRQDLRATQILTQKTEAVRLCTWSQLSSLPPSFTDFYYTLGTTNSPANTIYSGSISVNPASSLPAAYRDQVKLITINLVWTNNFGGTAVTHSRQMQTLVAYYGLVNYMYGAGFKQQ
jgi:prepilin-type N-terminal cleavage/methylation domain-containing protein